MARQGLMDDSGYDFFDVSDCSNYESCREDAYNDGYEQGRADAIKEFARAYEQVELIGCEHCEREDDDIPCWECIAEQLRSRTNEKWQLW